MVCLDQHSRDLHNQKAGYLLKEDRDSQYKWLRDGEPKLREVFESKRSLARQGHSCNYESEAKEERVCVSVESEQQSNASQIEQVSSYDENEERAATAGHARKQKRDGHEKGSGEERVVSDGESARAVLSEACFNYNFISDHYSSGESPCQDWEN